MADVVLTGTVTPDRKLIFDGELPPDTPVGVVEIVIRPLIKIDENYGTRPATAGEIRKSPMFGMWADRDDIGDSADYVAKMRGEAAQRRDPWNNQE